MLKTSSCSGSCEQGMLMVMVVRLSLSPPFLNYIRSILCKTTGVGAMIRLMGYIHVRFLNDEIRQGLQKNNGYFYEPYITIAVSTQIRA